jgi:hypothetical protein
MGSRDMIGETMEAKAANAVIEELERQAAKAPQRLSVRRHRDQIDVRGAIDVDAVVMVVVGSMVGRP